MEWLASDAAVITAVNSAFLVAWLTIFGVIQLVQFFVSVAGR